MLEKIDGPVVLSLIRAPSLPKSEIANFFEVEEGDFESEEQGKGRYKLTVKNGEIGIKMFSKIKKNTVRSLITNSTWEGIM